MVGSGLKSLYQFLKKIDSRSAWSGGDYDISINCAINPFWALSPLNRSWTVIATQYENKNVISTRRGGPLQEYMVNNSIHVHNPPKK